MLGPLESPQFLMLFSDSLASSIEYAALGFQRLLLGINAGSPSNGHIGEHLIVRIILVRGFSEN